MAAKHIAVPSCYSCFAHALYGSQMIDRFLYWGDHRNNLKSGEIEGSCQLHASDLRVLRVFDKLNGS